jgi:hypothetical protein
MHMNLYIIRRRLDTVPSGLTHGVPGWDAGNTMDLRTQFRDKVTDCGVDEACPWEVGVWEERKVDQQVCSAQLKGEVEIP